MKKKKTIKQNVTKHQFILLSLSQGKFLGILSFQGLQIKIVFPLWTIQCATKDTILYWPMHMTLDNEIGQHNYIVLNAKDLGNHFKSHIIMYQYLTLSIHFDIGIYFFVKISGEHFYISVIIWFFWMYLTICDFIELRSHLDQYLLHYNFT